MITVRSSRLAARVCFVLVLACVSFLVVYWTDPAIATDILIVTESSREGWEDENDEVCRGNAPSTAFHAFVQGPPDGTSSAPRGRGSLNFQIGANGNSRVFFRTERFATLNLEEIAAADGRLTYAYNVQAQGTTQNGRAPWLALDIDRDNNGQEDDTLVYEPATTTPGDWRQANAKTGTWWSTTDREAGTGATPSRRQSLTQFRARFPLAEVVYMRIGAGPVSDGIHEGCEEPSPTSQPDWTGFSGNVDLLSVRMFTNDVAFDFEPTPTDSSPSEGSPIPTFTRTRTSTPTPSGSTTTASPTPSESSPTPDPTNTDPSGRCRAPQGQNVITGSNRGETLRGTKGDDVICSFGGNDLVSGRGGDDILRLGAGNDEGFGNAGWDDVLGARGRDVLNGNEGSDDLVGGPGRDRCVGGPGRDRFTSCERRLR